MHVKIERVTKTQGIISSKTIYGIQVEVTFSNEELAILNAYDFVHNVILGRVASLEKGAKDRGLTFYMLIHGNDTHYLETPLDAKLYEAELKESLQEAKAFLDGNAEFERPAEIYEL